LFLPPWLLDIFTKYGYGAVFAGVAVEGAGVPIPGETVLLAGAVLAHLGRLSFPLVVVSAIAGGLTGDNLGFLIGRLGGRRLAERYGRPLGLTKTRLEEFDRFFERHGARTVFIARFVTGLRVVAAVLAGGSGMPWWKFAAFNAAGVATWSIAVASAGYLLGASWDQLERLVGGAGLVLLVAVIAAGGFLLARARRASTS
jgi:membrane protein DedA with SNARE-associated domain